MGHIAVAIPAGFSLAFFRCLIVDLPGLYHGGIELGVTTYAVVHDDLCAGVFSHDGLSFAVRDEIGHMFHTVHPLEEIFVCDIVMWYMAIITCGVAGMR